MTQSVLLFLADAVAVTSAFYGQGTGPIFLNELMCTGTETSLLDCPYNSDPNCVHNEDAGVRCIGERKYQMTT